MFGTWSALAHIDGTLCNGQVKVSACPSRSKHLCWMWSTAGAGARLFCSPGQKGDAWLRDRVSVVGHREEQGVGAASDEVLWVAVQEQPMPASRQLGTAVPKLLCSLPSDGAACFFLVWFLAVKDML